MAYDKDKIKDLLNLSEKMIIPAYQREFVWNDVEGGEFLEDVISSSPVDPLFLGTFIFNREQQDKIEIVDGQQRITTILTLLISCRVVAREMEFSKYFQNNVQRLITLQPMSKVDEEPGARLESGGEIGRSLKVMSRSEWDGKYDKERMKGKRGWNRIKKAYGFFYEELKKGYKKEDTAAKLIEKIQNIEYIDISVRSSLEAISTFERVNARGQHLAVYDLVKAFLFSKALSPNDPGLRNIEDEWKEIRNNARHTESTLKKILYYFYFSKKGRIKSSELYRGLRDMAEENVRTFVDGLKSFSKFYSLIVSKEYFTNGIKDYLINTMEFKETKMNDEDRIQKVSKSLFAISLFGGDRVYPLIYSTLQALSVTVKKLKEDGKKETDEIDAWISLLEFIEDFCFVATRITHVTSQYSGELERLYTEYCRAFCNEKSGFVKNVQQVKQKLQRLITVSEDLFVEHFTEITYQDKNDRKIIYYIFDRLNNTVKGTRKRIGPTKSSGIFSPEQYKVMGNNIEHILARSRDIGEEGNMDIVDNIGNLLVIHRKDNSKLGNKEPHDKIEDLREMLDEEEINELYIKDFIEYYEEKCPEGTEWNAEIIKQRSKDLARQIYKIVYYN